MGVDVGSPGVCHGRLELRYVGGCCGRGLGERYYVFFDASEFGERVGWCWGEESEESGESVGG